MACILIVDDDESDRLLLQSLLEDEHDLLLAANGEEALKLYLHNAVDVVVTDIQMPRGDGIELISALKGLDPDVAVVAISGQKPHKLGIAQMAGAKAILSKPINRQMLIDAIGHVSRAEED